MTVECGDDGARTAGTVMTGKPTLIILPTPDNPDMSDVTTECLINLTEFDYWYYWYYWPHYR